MSSPNEPRGIDHGVGPCEPGYTEENWVGFDTVPPTEPAA
jgi:hypothetical protein